MSLQSIQSVKTKSGKLEILKRMLKDHPLGELTDDEDSMMKWLFNEFYQPDPGHIKYPVSDIDRFYIGTNTTYGKQTTCFYIRLKNGTCDPVSSARLADKDRTPKENLTKALRDAVKPQIQEFRRLHPLNPSSICPIANIPLGSDAEVDHYNPTFQKLSEEWLSQNPNVKIKTRTRESPLHSLEEPFQANWIQFHQERANLRWLSKEGNKRAHFI